jgi:hypothetical protein
MVVYSPSRIGGEEGGEVVGIAVCLSGCLASEKVTNVRCYAVLNVLSFLEILTVLSNNATMGCDASVSSCWPTRGGGWRMANCTNEFFSSRRAELQRIIQGRTSRPN